VAKATIRAQAANTGHEKRSILEDGTAPVTMCWGCCDNTGEVDAASFVAVLAVVVSERTGGPVML
jgi:hypothetical protein